MNRHTHPPRKDYGFKSTNTRRGIDLDWTIGASYALQEHFKPDPLQTYEVPGYQAAREAVEQAVKNAGDTVVYQQDVDDYLDARMIRALNTAGYWII